MSTNVKKPDYLLLASLLDLAFGVIGLVVGLILLPTLPSIMDGTFFIAHMGYNDSFMSLMMGIMVITIIVVSIPLFVAGIGLYQGYAWSKILHTISWIPTLIMFPIGTFLGILSIWLVQTNAVVEYLSI